MNNRSVIRVSLNEQDQNDWDNFKTLAGFSDSSKAIKFAIKVTKELWLIEQNRRKELVPHTLIERISALERASYKPVLQKKKILEMTKQGVIEKEIDIYTTEKPKTDTTNTL